MTDYCTLSEVKAQIDRTKTTSDTVIEALITAASRAIDKFTNHPEDYYVATVAATSRLFTGSGGPVQRIDDCISITAVAVKDTQTDTTYTAWNAGDYIPFRGDQRFPEFTLLPYEALMIDPTGDQSHFTAGRRYGPSHADLWFGHTSAYGQFGGWGGFRESYNPRQAHGVPTVQVTARWGYADEVPEQIKQAAIIQASRWYKRGQSSWDDTLSSGEFGQLLYRLELDPDMKMILTRWTKPAVGRK